MMFEEKSELARVKKERERERERGREWKEAKKKEKDETIFFGTRNLCFFFLNFAWKESSLQKHSPLEAKNMV